MVVHLSKLSMVDSRKCIGNVETLSFNTKLIVDEKAHIALKQQRDGSTIFIAIEKLTKLSKKFSLAQKSQTESGTSS